MGRPRLRDFGGTCAKGHLLTRETAHLVEGTVRCAVCLRDNKRALRRRQGATPRRTKPDPDPKPCPGCGRSLPLAAYGQIGTRKDGAPRWRARCPACRDAATNERRKAERRKLRHERQEMTAWIVRGVGELRGRGMGLEVILAGLGITRQRWDGWRSGRRTPELATIRAVSDRLLELRAGMGDAPGRG